MCWNSAEFKPLNSSVIFPLNKNSRSSQVASYFNYSLLTIRMMFDDHLDQTYKFDECQREMPKKKAPSSSILLVIVLYTFRKIFLENITIISYDSTASKLVKNIAS